MGTWKLAREHTRATDLEYLDSDCDACDEAEQAQVACLYRSK